MSEALEKAWQEYRREIEHSFPTSAQNIMEKVFKAGWKARDLEVSELNAALDSMQKAL